MTNKTGVSKKKKKGKKSKVEKTLKFKKSKEPILKCKTVEQPEMLFNIVNSAKNLYELEEEKQSSNLRKNKTLNRNKTKLDSSIS